MNERDELLRRVTAANPVPDDVALPDSVADGRPPVSLLINEKHTPRPGAVSRRTGRLWRGPLVAFGTAVTLLVVVAASILLVRGDGVDTADDSTITTQASLETTVTTAAPATPTTAVPVMPDEWSTILATTTAGAAPPAATCPDGAEPDRLGPADQPRPWGAMWSNQAAAFDQRSGKVLFIDEKDLWAFDVCTNGWQAREATFAAYGFFVEGELVYDVDSDATIALLANYVAVYDAAANTWTRRAIPAEYDDVGRPGLGAVYDPQSGLVVVQTDASGLLAYDVDNDTWTTIGRIGEDDTYGPLLVGYVADADRLVFLESNQQTSDGLLVDPRTGESVAFAGPEGGVFAGFGRLNYAVGTDSPFVEGDSGGMWHLDPATFEWNQIDLGVGPARSGLLAALVDDPINDRIMWIYGYGPGYNGARFYDANGIWAVDPATSEWTQLLEPSGGRTWEAYTWVNPAPFGIEVELNPSTLPPVPGEYEIEIDVSNSEPWTLPWACPRLLGAVEPDLSTDTIEELCIPLVSDVSETVEYPTVVTVTVTDEVIWAGALTIAVNGAWGDWAGTALLPIDD